MDATLDGSGQLQDFEVEPGRNYVYMVELALDGRVVTAGQIEMATPAMRLALHQNHPNPFNPSTRIAFDLPHASRVRLSIYDHRGRRVATVAEGDFSAGRHRVVWEGRDEASRPVGSGIYHSRLVAEGRAITRPMVLLK